MKKALISPTEQVHSGYRIAQVETTENIFPVGGLLYWMDCDDEVIADQWYFDTNENVIKVIPRPTIVAANNQPISNGAQTL